MTTVSTKEEDYLEVDKEIRNQKYCLLSFLSPDKILVNKETYYISHFLKKLSKDIETLFNGLKDKYPADEELINNIKDDHSYLFDIKQLDEQYKFVKEINSTIVENDFHKDNNFQTSMRGIKVRGSFSSIEEAKNRSEFLKKIDKNHDIYIAEVGCWCPFSPNPGDLENQEYGETQLNTLMKEYKKNQEERDEVFEKRKIDSISRNNVIHEEEEVDEEEIKLSDITKNVFIDEDPWLQKSAEGISSTTIPISDDGTTVTNNTTTPPVETTTATVETTTSPVETTTEQ